MNTRTWRQAGRTRAYFASADELHVGAIGEAIRSAWRRWPWLDKRPAAFLADADHLDDAREALGPAAEIRQVDGMPDGWALWWPGDDGVQPPTDQEDEPMTDTHNQVPRDATKGSAGRGSSSKPGTRMNGKPPAILGGQKAEGPMVRAARLRAIAHGTKRIGRIGGRG